MRTGPATVRVKAHTTAAKMAARRAVEPRRCSDWCSALRSIDAATALEAPPDLVALAGAAGPLRAGPRTTFCTGRLTGVRLRAAGAGPRDLPDAGRRFESAMDRPSAEPASWRARSKNGERQGLPRNGQRLRAFPRYAAAGCTWPLARYAPEHRS
ncbi:Uncharacterised protein [Mycobacteroides abscessus subsp. abscessus]|nr:Uncharacterised protein [Mycobacteroides abscessus subsp. abscessus]